MADWILMCEHAASRRVCPAGAKDLEPGKRVTMKQHNGRIKPDEVCRGSFEAASSKDRLGTTTDGQD